MAAGWNKAAYNGGAIIRGLSMHIKRIALCRVSFCVLTYNNKQQQGAIYNSTSKTRLASPLLLKIQRSEIHIETLGQNNISPLSLLLHQQGRPLVTEDINRPTNKRSWSSQRYQCMSTVSLFSGKYTTLEKSPSIHSPEL
ncbi:hypothetical protein C0Q70_16831 [Pomacea canaliculata]|uniref:Uncharacterized protein n=1 Tax=Pomacea canaliculata TaxID=400727 RepID=A0A2T7NQW0_POMCA|nr:hypothetical protein C0Q70_16831 [Pomacea canaliculata]